MPVFEHAPVNAHLIHKEHLDDVLISNFRSELPTRMTRESLNLDILDDKDRALMLEYYLPIDAAEGLCCPTEGVLMRRSVPLTLPKSAAEEEGLEFLADYYSETSSKLVLHALYLREEHEIVLMNRFVAPEDHLTPYKRHCISQITDRMPCNERSSRYYMNMINDLQNYFFYRKHHEHVPGTMLIEAARQAVYAQYYRTSPHNRGEVTLMMKKVDCDFDGYTDSNYPVVLCTESTSDKPEYQGTGFDSRTTQFFQRNRLLATIEIVGMPIKMKTFKRLRIVKPEPDHWFVPVKAFANSAIFIGPDGKRFEGKLRKVARGGMEIVFDNCVDPETALDFVLSVDGIGYVDGKVRVATNHQEGNAFSSRLDIAELSSESERRWFEAIKNFSHVELGAGPY